MKLANASTAAFAIEFDYLANQQAEGLASLYHLVKTEQVNRIKATGVDSFLSDLRKVLERRKKEDKHFDRKTLPLKFQHADFLDSVMVDVDGRHMRLISNAKRDALKEKSRLEYAAWQNKRKYS